jgi:hypothetical protein
MTISAGGMNSELGYADYLGERVSHGRAHWFHSMGYLLGKLAYDRYYRTSADSQFSDIRSVTNYYSNRGYGIESSDLRAYSLISLFTSATTWAFAGGLGQFILSGDPVVHPLQIGMFELPQIDFFMYAAGPAFKIAPKLHFGNFSIPISYEQVFRGTSTIEIGIGSEYQFNQSHFLDFGGQILIGRGTGVRTYFEWEPTSFITVAAGADFLSPKLLRAQRLSPELLPTIGKEVFARLGLAF